MVERLGGGVELPHVEGDIVTVVFPGKLHGGVVENAPHSPAAAAFIYAQIVDIEGIVIFYVFRKTWLRKFAKAIAHSFAALSCYNDGQNGISKDFLNLLFGIF